MNADELKNADEVVRALRDYASDCDGYNCCQCTLAWVCDELDGCAPKIIADLIDSLTAQLSASQRREKAAVEDMTEMAKCRLLGTCTFCKHKNTPDARYKPCKGCEQPNGSCKNFEWCGPQAEKGEADGN